MTPIRSFPITICQFIWFHYRYTDYNIGFHQKLTIQYNTCILCVWLARCQTQLGSLDQWFFYEQNSRPFKLNWFLRYCSKFFTWIFSRKIPSQPGPPRKYPTFSLGLCLPTRGRGAVGWRGWKCTVKIDMARTRPCLWKLFERPQVIMVMKEQVATVVQLTRRSTRQENTHILTHPYITNQM